MIGVVEKSEAKTGKSGKNYFKVTIGGKTGNSFDEHFFNSAGKTFEVEETQQGEYTNFKFIKEITQAQPSKPQAQAQPNTTANDIKLLLIPKALECACDTAKQTCDGHVDSKNIVRVADAYLDWMIKKAME